MKMYERIAADRRALTIDFATGVGIGFGGDKAYQAWLASQAPGQADGAARQSGSIARLAALFPGAVKTRPH